MQKREERQMTAVQDNRVRGSIWTSRLVRALAGQFGTGGDPTVLRSLGQLVPLTPVGRGDRPHGSTPSSHRI